MPPSRCDQALRTLLPTGRMLRLAAAFATIRAGIQLHRSIFASYHMKMYLEVYALGAAAVGSIHAVFAIVNPANDLAGAALSDDYASRHRGSRMGLLVGLCALWPIFTATPFWPQAAAYFGPQSAALLGLSVEDTIFSCAAIALGAAWSDATSSEGERIKMARLETVVLSAVGAAMAGITYTRWVAASGEGAAASGEGAVAGGEGPLSFARFATGAAAVGSAVTFCGLGWLRSLDRAAGAKGRQAILHEASAGAVASEPTGLRLLSSFGRVTLRHRNFWCFVVMSVLSEMQVRRAL